MKQITKELLTYIFLDYYLNHNNFTQDDLAKKLDINRSSISNWLHQKNAVSPKYFLIILNFLSTDNNTDAFRTFLINSLHQKGFDKNTCKHILAAETTLEKGLQNLINQYSSVHFKLQDTLNASSIISKFRVLCLQSENEFTIVNQELISGHKIHQIPSWIISSKDIDDPSIITQQNYLILKFANGYQIAIILTNASFENSINISDSIMVLKEKNQIQLIIIFTDNEVSFSCQKYFIERHNLFFETISPSDLTQVSIDNMHMRNLLTTDNHIKSYFYAKVILDRLTSFYNIIKTEIIFYTHYNKNKPLPDISNLSLEDFSTKIMLKEIFKYCYTDRHTIYFERTCLKTLVEKTLQNRALKKLNTVLEIGFPNSFLTSSISDYCEDILLFTTSYHTQAVITRIKNENKSLFPENMYFHTVSMNPQYINQYCNDLNNIDLIVIGFGQGSYINNLTEYLRYINNWLAPNGLLFISFKNSESVVFRKQAILQNDFDNTSLYYFEQGKRNFENTANPWQKSKKYNKEEIIKLISTYIKIHKCYTYPFLSYLTDSNQQDENLRIEVREADKLHALSQKGKYGHHIILLGTKIQTDQTDRTSPEKRCTEIQKMIYHYIDKHQIDYDVIHHSAAIDTKNLFKILLDLGNDNSQFHLIKTIILKRHKSSKLEYIITLRNQKLKFNNILHLLPEKEVTQSFHTGSLSPFVSLPDIQQFTGWKGNISSVGFENLNREYVIFSSGTNGQSIKLKTRDFIQLVDDLKVKSFSSNEIIP